MFRRKLLLYSKAFKSQITFMNTKAAHVFYSCDKTMFSVITITFCLFLAGNFYSQQNLSIKMKTNFQRKNVKTKIVLFTLSMLKTLRLNNSNMDQ